MCVCGRVCVCVCVFNEKGFLALDFKTLRKLLFLNFMARSVNE